MQQQLAVGSLQRELARLVAEALLALFGSKLAPRRRAHVDSPLAELTREGHSLEELFARETAHDLGPTQESEASP